MWRSFVVVVAAVVAQVGASARPPKTPPTMHFAPSMAGGGLLASTKVFGAANLAGLGLSVATGSHLHLDLIGTGAFVGAAWAARGASARSALSSVIVAGWATRLASFLFYRATQVGHDLRLEDTLSTVPGAVGFWVISFAWGVITLLPHSLAASSRKVVPLGPGAAASVALCAMGLSTEIAADAQKWLFKQDPRNRGRFCDVGVWACSQHPNWFGNLALWTGLFTLNAPVLAPTSLALAACSPLFLASLFNAQATGQLTNSVGLADAKYATDPAYAAYRANVPLFIPKDPVKLIKALFWRPAA